MVSLASCWDHSLACEESRAIRVMFSSHVEQLLSFVALTPRSRVFFFLSLRQFLVVLLRALTEGISSSLVWFRCDSLEQHHQGFHLVSMVSSSSSPFESRPDHACPMVVLVRFDKLRMKAKVPRFSAWM